MIDLFKKQRANPMFFDVMTFVSVTESRPLSVPMKVMPDSTPAESWTTSDERMKELIAHAWDAVKRLTLQVPNYTLYCCYVT